MTKAVPGGYLRRLIADFERRIAYKREVVARHAPGTPWHTRAMREIAALENSIATWERQLEDLHAD